MEPKWSSKGAQAQMEPNGAQMEPGGAQMELKPGPNLQIAKWKIQLEARCPKMKNPTRAETPKNQNIKTDILILGPPAYGVAPKMIF